MALVSSGLHRHFPNKSSGARNSLGTSFSTVTSVNLGGVRWCFSLLSLHLTLRRKGRTKEVENRALLVLMLVLKCWGTINAASETAH